MTVTSPEVLRSMWTSDLYVARTDAGVECLQPLLRSAGPAVRERACSNCPLAAVCGEIRARENTPGAYTSAASAVSTATVEAAVSDELVGRRARGIRSAVGWGEAA